MEEMKRIPKRSEVPVESTWALEDLYQTPADWEQDVQKLSGYPEKCAAFQGKLGESAASLLGWFRLMDEIHLLSERAATYAYRLSDTDMANSAWQAMKGRATTVMIEIQSAASFADPEILSIPEETLNRFYQDCPDLELYRHALDVTRALKDHVLSPAEEKILAAAGELSESPDNIGNMFRNADLKFPDVQDSEGNSHQLTSGSFIPLMMSQDRILRKNAFETLYHTYAGFQNTTAAILDAQVKQLKFFASARKYSDTLHASLSATEVPVEVYYNLIDTVHQHMNTMYRYMALRKKLLGLDELHMYDIYVPMISDVEQKVSFEEAKQNVLNAVQPLGENYQKVLKEAFDSRWIDVYENEGKCSGAYSSGSRPHPYVLLNQKDTLDDEFTIVHEMGHAMHSYLSMKNQPVVYSDYVIFVAEVASTCNEVLLMQYLLGKTSDRRQRASLINYFLEQFRTTLYRQTMFAEFELKMNELCASGESLTADTLNRLYHDLNKLYYGDNVTVDTEIAGEWARIPHFFYNFYVFQYATGFSAAIALAMKILREGKPAADAYLKFLSSGCSTDPISLLKIAGVDMASPAPIHEALSLFDTLITELEELTSSES